MRPVRALELLKQIGNKEKPAAYEICWNTHATSLRESINNYLDHSLFADVTISCENKHIKCHRTTLAAASTYFQDIFLEETVGNNPNYFVAVVNMKHSILKKLIEYMYKGTVNVQKDELQDFLTGGDQLGIYGLCDKRSYSDMAASDFVESNISLESEESSIFKSDLPAPKVSSKELHRPAKIAKKDLLLSERQSNVDNEQFAKPIPVEKNDIYLPPGIPNNEQLFQPFPTAQMGKKKRNTKKKSKKRKVNPKVMQNENNTFSDVSDIDSDIFLLVNSVINDVCELVDGANPGDPDETKLATQCDNEKLISTDSNPTPSFSNSSTVSQPKAGGNRTRNARRKIPVPAPLVEGKSMPIHCIIEVSSRDRDLGKCETSGGNSNVTSSEIGPCRLSPSDMSSLKVKDSSLTAPENKVVEVDDFVIIPAGTPFQDVVTTVLTLLGYPKDTIRQAQGTIALRNWKPLRLDQVCDSPHKTVGDILNDLTNHATLRVLVTRAKGGTTEDLKEKLLRLLLAQSSTLLMGAGCPLDEVTLSQLVKGHWPQNLAEDVKRRFDQWYTAQHQQSLGGLVESLQQQQPHHHQHSHQHSSHSMISSGQHQIGGNGGSGLSNTHHHSHLVNGSGGGTLSAVHQHHHHHHDLQSNKSYDDDHTNHPVFHGLTTQKTRMRTSFDPEMELPKLQQWFAENPHPSRHQIQQYVRDLNLLDCRKDRKPLDVNNVIYWFKNARAAQKRNEMRYNGLSPHQSFSHHHPHSHSQNPSHHHHHHHLNTSPMGIHANGSELRGERDSSHDMHSHHTRRRVSSGEQDRENNNDPEHDSVHDHSGSSCRDSDDQDTKENIDDNENDQENNDRELNCERDGDNSRAKDNRHHQGQEKKSENDSLVVVKEEHDDDFISVDVELSEANNGNNQSMKNSSECCNNNEPKDLSSAKSQCDEAEDNSHKDDKSSIIIGGDEKKHLSVVSDMRHSLENETGELITGEASNNSSSTSASPRSSPGISPNHHYDFAGPPSMVSRYHPFFDHPSFMAYRHFNSFNFGQNFSGPNGADGHGAYEASLGVVGRKALLPLGKPSPGMDIFHDFPSGVAMVPSRGSGGHLSGGPGNAETISRLRGDEMFPPRPASSADIISSIINSNRELGLSPLNLGSHHPGQSSLALDERRKRNRTFIDPVTEVPRLEQWFGLNTHPSHNLILKYTDELNRMPYRQKFPKLEPKNVQFWFKNRRAKCKRLKMTL